VYFLRWDGELQSYHNYLLIDEAVQMAFVAVVCSGGPLTLAVTATILTKRAFIYSLYFARVPPINLGRVLAAVT